MQPSLRHFGKILLTFLTLTCAAGVAHADWDDHRHGYYGHDYHRGHRGPEVVIAPTFPLFVPAPVIVYQRPTTVNMQCASGQMISVTGTGSFTHLLNKANRICAAQYPAVAPVIVQGAPEGSSYCREYQTNVVVGGVRQQTYGTACRQPNGAWQIAN